MKKLLLFLLFIVLMMGACGNMRGQKKIDRMVDYINAKYTDDSFEYRNITGGHLGSNTVSILVESKNYPGKPITVRCITYTEDNKEKEDYIDNYLGIKFEDETRAFIKERFKDEFNDSVHISYTPDDIYSKQDGDKDTGFKEYIEDTNSSVYVYALITLDITEDRRQETEDKIKNALRDAAFSGDIYFTPEAVDISSDDEEKEVYEWVNNLKWSDDKISYVNSQGSETTVELIRFEKGSRDEYIQFDRIIGYSSLHKN